MTDSAATRVLIVEDEQLIAMMIEDMLIDMGCAVVATAHSLSTGLAQARKGDIALAVLDINLNGERSFAIADVLTERNIPFFFLTGFGTNGLSEHYRHAPTLAKPFSLEALEHMVRRMTAAQR